MAGSNVAVPSPLSIRAYGAVVQTNDPPGAWLPIKLTIGALIQ